MLFYTVSFGMDREGAYVRVVPFARHEGEFAFATNEFAFVT